MRRILKRISNSAFKMKIIMILKRRERKKPRNRRGLKRNNRKINQQKKRRKLVERRTTIRCSSRDLILKVISKRLKMKLEIMQN